MSDQIDPSDTKQATMLTPQAETMLEEFAKEVVNEGLEKPVNLLIKGWNYVTGSQLPPLDITGIPSRPPKPVKFIKA